MATFQEEKDSPILDDDRISTLLAKHSQLNSSIPISFEYYPPKTEQVFIQKSLSSLTMTSLTMIIIIINKHSLSS